MELRLKTSIWCCNAEPVNPARVQQKPFDRSIKHQLPRPLFFPIFLFFCGQASARYKTYFDVEKRWAVTWERIKPSLVWRAFTCVPMFGGLFNGWTSEGCASREEALAGTMNWSDQRSWPRHVFTRLEDYHDGPSRIRPEVWEVFDVFKQRKVLLFFVSLSQIIRSFFLCSFAICQISLWKEKV